MTYKGWMELTVQQWVSYNYFWTKTLKEDLAKGKLTQQQYDAIWKHREALLGGLRDNTGEKAAPDPTIPSSSWGDLSIDASGVVSAIKDDLKTIGDALGGSSKYIIYGFFGLVLILILGRR